MNLDSIVRINISSDNLQMGKTGFGTPIIIAEHDYLQNRVHTFNNLEGLFALRNSDKERGLSEKEKFQNQPLYGMASAIFAQNPTVPKIKIGKRLANESITDALANIQNEAAGEFYGVLTVPKESQEILELAKAIETKRILFGVDLDDSTIDLAPTLNKAEQARRIFSIFKQDPNDYPAAALMGRMLSQPPGSSSWAYKRLAGIEGSKLSLDKSESLTKAHINQHLEISRVGLTMGGKAMSGEWIDIVHGIDWLFVSIQERLFRLFSINEKIPYTIKGVDLVRSEIMAQLKEAVYRGLLAPDPEPQVSIPNIMDIPADIRGSRILPDIFFTARLAGAIHEVHLRGTVTV